MRIDHGGSHIFVSEEFLDSSDVVAVLEQVSGEAVTQGVAADPFGNSGFLRGVPDGTLQSGGIKMMASGVSTARIKRAF